MNPTHYYVIFEAFKVTMTGGAGAMVCANGLEYRS
jgi:hypothetical protein